MLARIAKRLNPDLGLHCLPLHFLAEKLMLDSSVHLPLIYAE